MKALMAPQRNAGKDEYIVDLEDNEKLYWLVTESGLIGAFGFAALMSPLRHHPLILKPQQSDLLFWRIS